MTAFELCQIYDGQNFRVKGGIVIWNFINYRYRNDKCFVQRIVPVSDWYTIKSSYISPNTMVEVVKLNRSNGLYELI